MKKILLILYLFFYSCIGYFIVGMIAIIFALNSRQSDGTTEQRERQKQYFDSVDRTDSIAWKQKIDSIDRK